MEAPGIEPGSSAYQADVETTLPCSRCPERDSNPQLPRFKQGRSTSWTHRGTDALRIMRAFVVFVKRPDAAVRRRQPKAASLPFVAYAQQGCCQALLDSRASPAHTCSRPLGE